MCFTLFIIVSIMLSFPDVIYVLKKLIQKIKNAISAIITNTILFTFKIVSISRWNYLPCDYDLLQLNNTILTLIRM